MVYSTMEIQRTHLKVLERKREGLGFFLLFFSFSTERLLSVALKVQKQ